MSDLSGQVTHLEWSATPLWLIPLLPFLGAAANAIFGRRLQSSDVGRDLSKRWHIGSFGVSAVAVGAMLTAFALVVVNWVGLLGLSPGNRYLYSHAWQMVRIGSLDVNFSFAMDPLSALMALIITGVGSLIHIYACSYMETEPAYWRFFTYLNLFVFSMLLLVLGDNLIVMFFGWEGVGLCSYLLIGFWYKDYKKATAGMKAFVVNRVGDWGVICGLGLLFWGLGGAWTEHGHYRPDFRARFVAVEAEPYADAEEEGEGHGGTKAEHGAEHGHEGAQGAHGEHGARTAGEPPKPQELPKPPAIGAEPLKKREVGQRGKPRASGSKGTLTMTTYPGALVYLGVDTAAALSARNQPFAVSPFLRKEIPTGVHNITIIPGDGAVVAGDGIEGAILRDVDIEPGDDKLIASVGPTVTFRELHDQLAMKDHEGKAFLKEALAKKTVWGGMSLITLACLLFFVGATGKSAQIPLYVWLPDAMAGPTPVSALIHAATMVTAGVYMIARLNFLFSLSPTACGVVALIGASTALFAATIGFFQYDIKKVLAYSTVSQLGFMFIGVGVGAYWAGVFHLMTHAFFKACLFLGSGSVIHGMHAVEHDEVAVQDMRNMGGLRRVMPLTARTYFIACLAITAAPIPFFAGFWSKDEILWKAFTTESTGAIPGVLVYVMGLAAALGTSFYMWRSYYLTFEGPHAKKEIAKKVHESPLAITGVLMVLALLSTVSGVVCGFSMHILGGHGEPLLEQWLGPVLSMGHAQTHFSEQGLGLELGLMALSVAGAIASWWIARSRYGEGRSPTWAADEARAPGFTLMQNKYYVDEIYQGSVVKWFMALRLVFAEMDTWIVDGLVNGLSVVVRLVSWINGAIDHYLVDGLVNFVAEGTLAAGSKLRTVQTGRIQNYVYGLLGGVAFFAIVQYFLRVITMGPPAAPNPWPAEPVPNSLSAAPDRPMRGDAMSNVRKLKSFKLLGSLLLALGLVLGLGQGRARAEGPAQPAARPAVHAQLAHGKIDVHSERGHVDEAVELVGEGAELTGSFVIENDKSAPGPLHVTRVAVRTSAADPRSPPGVTVELEGGGQQAVLQPGESKKAIVKWATTGVRARQLYGHVLVESNSVSTAASGATEPGRPSAIGIHAERGYGLWFIGDHVLSILTFLPLLAVIAIFIAHLVGYKEDKNLRLLTVVIMALNLALATWLYSKFDTNFTKLDGNDGYQFIEHGVWIRSLNVEYFVGVDGVSISMVFLTALISFVGAVASYSVHDQLKGYFAMYSLLVTGMFGVFVSLDLFLFYVFWEVMLLPMYFLIGIWGGPRRQYAAIKFFIYTLAGSVFMLLAFIWFYLNCDPGYLVDGTAVTRVFSIPELARVAWTAKGLTIMGVMAVKIVWVWLFVGFAIKIPMFPFHTWLPDAHVEAPTAISVILAGVLLKMGTYGILRINFTLLPEASQWAAGTMAVFGVINILYGAFCAMAQKDLKKLVAYSSVSHMGFCLLALGAMTPQGIQACLVQMFNHGLITAMLFSLVGVVYDRVHTRDLDKFGGLASEMPLYTAFVGFAFMASLGLPGLSGFWGEAMTFIGAFARFRALTMLAATGVIVTAAYHLWALQRMFLGKFREEWRHSKYLEPFGGKFPEINGRELLTLAPLAVLVLVLGFWPRPLLNLVDKGALDIHRMVDRPGPTQVAAASLRNAQERSATAPAPQTNKVAENK